MFNFILHHLVQASQICQIITALLAAAHWIRQLRKDLGLTQEALAERVGVEPRTVQRWEKGENEPRQEYMVKMQNLEKDLLPVPAMFDIEDVEGPSRPGGVFGGRIIRYG